LYHHLDHPGGTVVRMGGTYYLYYFPSEHLR
jgi:hypothetical protein